MNLDLLPDLIRSCTKLNSYVARGALRKYQSDLLSTGTFALRLESTGEELRPSESRLVAGYHIAYRFRPTAGEGFWLCTALIARGFPLAVTVLDDGSVHWGLSRRPLPPEKMAAYGQAVKEPGTPLVSSSHSSTCLVIGNPNFAHFIWNELSGLAAWLPHADPTRIAELLVLATHEPSGPIDALAPQLSRATILRSRSSRTALRDSNGVIYVRVGSQIVTSQARKMVADFAVAHADPEFARRIAAFRGERHPIVWINVRHSKRTAHNLGDFLKAAVAAIRERYPAAGFLFDGFSVPIDYAENQNYDGLRPGFTERIDRISGIIDEIAEAEEHRKPGFLGAMINLNGLRLVDCFRAALDCDFYVSHAGTLQHKIGWINPVPGIIHLPPTLNPKRAEGYYSRMVEDGSGPSVLAPAALRRVKASDDEPDNRNNDYVFTDIRAAVDDVIAKLDHAMAGAQASSC